MEIDLGMALLVVANIVIYVITDNKTVEFFAAVGCGMAFANIILQLTGGMQYG